MSPSLTAPSRHILRRYLLAGYVMFIAYASLAPFGEWGYQGYSFYEVLVAPLHQTYTLFDALSNLLAYVPLGVLLGLALRGKGKAVASIAGATVLGMLLSGMMEYLQLYLPGRASSNVDILSNSVGTMIGATLAIIVSRQSWFFRVMQWRTGWFQRGAVIDSGLALLVLWTFVQINPTLPMLGSVFITEPVERMYAPMQEVVASGWESLAAALNLLMAGLLLLLVLRERRHVMIGIMLLLCGVALAKFLAAALLLKSWALMLWLDGDAMLGIVIGLLLLVLTASMPRSWLYGVGGLAVLAYLVLIHGVMDSSTPSAASRLYYWRYGHLRNYSGLSQSLSSLFPILLAIYLGWARSQNKHQEGRS